jgi:Kef-type K+ transport system membrane component KefB
MVGLLLGGILREINKKTKIPYTPMLLVLGIVLGYGRESFGIIGHSTEIIEKINPHLILLIFIPVLIF